MRFLPGSTSAMPDSHIGYTGFADVPQDSSIPRFSLPPLPFQASRSRISPDGFLGVAPRGGMLREENNDIEGST
jgi:hypothetical protein